MTISLIMMFLYFFSANRILGSSVSGLVSAMRGFNFVFAGCMVALAIVQIINSDSAFKVMADALSVIYTMSVLFSPTHGTATGTLALTNHVSCVHVL